jgi:hypothetical protein
MERCANQDKLAFMPKVETDIFGMRIKTAKHSFSFIITLTPKFEPGKSYSFRSNSSYLSLRALQLLQRLMHTTPGQTHASSIFYGRSHDGYMNLVCDREIQESNILQQNECCMRSELGQEKFYINKTIFMRHKAMTHAFTLATMLTLYNHLSPLWVRSEEKLLVACTENSLRIDVFTQYLKGIANVACLETTRTRRDVHGHPLRPMSTLLTSSGS